MISSIASAKRTVHGATPAPAKALADARAPKPSASQTPIPNLPSELANNPQYEIIRELGHGGMGVVYLAKNKPMDRLEVLKVVNKTLLDHPGAVERFLREIRSAAKLSHANVVGAYSAVQQGELLAFAMEYVEGEDLGSLVKTQGPLPIAHACFYVQQAAYGLQHAYEKQMVHRDIKPQNLILAREGRKHIVKVLDFGLAKVMREKHDDASLTGEGKMLGTPDYIAPEQTLDAAKADIRADIYSLGCTLYFLLSGRPPFSASSLGAILLAHQMQEAKPLNLVRPEVPAELAAVVRKMMAKNLAKRYQTPLEVVQALAPFVKQGTTPKSSLELSMGTAKEPVVVKAVKAESPPAPVASVKPPPPTPEAPPAVAWEALTEGDIASAPLRKSGVIRTRRPPVRKPWLKQKWLIGSGIGVGVLLLALLGMWARGVFQVKTKDGILTIQVNEPNADVYVDGEKVTVKWDNGGKKAEIRVKPGTHKVEVKKNGFSVDGKELTFKDGDREIFTALLLPEPRVAKPDAPPENVPPADDTKKPETTKSAVATAPRKADEKGARKLFKVRRAFNGKWIIVDDHLEQTSFDENVRLDFGDPAWKDYDFAVEVMQGEGNDQVCQLFRLTGGPEAFLYGLGHAGNSLFTIESGRQRLGNFKGHVDQGKWYKMLVRVRGKHIQCFLNDTTIFDVESDDHPSGCVGLRTWRTQYRFRNIKVTAPDGTVLLEGLPDLNHELPDEKGVVPIAAGNGFAPLFNGKDLTGWSVDGGIAEQWTVEGDTIVGRSHDFSTRNYLLTDKEYANFALRFDFKVEDGHHGVAIRAIHGEKMPLAGNRIFDHPLIKLMNPAIPPLEAKELTGTTHWLKSADAHVKPSAILSLPRDTWLSMEVVVRGDNCTATIDNKPLVDVTLDRNARNQGAFVPGLQRVKGKVGFQTNTGTVRFRKIEIKELPATKSQAPADTGAASKAPPPRRENELPPEAVAAAKAFKDSTAEGARSFWRISRAPSIS